MLEQAITLGCGDKAQSAAEIALQCWEQIFQVFSSLLGDSSVRMIFSRSLDLNQPAYPWVQRVAGAAVLAREQRELGEALHLLKASMAKRAETEIREANLSLMLTFGDILDGLIGERLTSHFMQAALCSCPPEKTA